MGNCTSKFRQTMELGVFIRKSKYHMGNDGSKSTFLWNWYYLSLNPNITWNIVIKNLKFPWDWSCLSAHPDIAWEIVKHHPNFEWDYNWLSRNPNITWKLCKKI